MNIGVISDVHGDYETLSRTLDQLEKFHQVEQVLCAGDLIGRGPEQNRVVKTIRERGIITVRGNHDEWVYNMEAENRAFLKSLPIDWQGKFGTTNVFMCHGKPGNNMWGMYRDHLSGTYLDMVLASLKIDVLITGHTHVPLHMRVNSGCIINPGSLYTFESTRPTSSTYGVLHLPEVTFEVFDARAQKPIPFKMR